MGEINLGKITGTQIFSVTAATATAPTGARIDDLVINAGTSAVNIGGVSIAIGGVAKITATSPFTCVESGSIRGGTGNTGDAGADAYTVILSLDSHVFPAGVNAATASSVTCNVVALKGSTQVAVTIGTISGLVTGLTTSIANNSSNAASFTAAATTTLTTKSGVLTIPVTVDGKVFTKQFSWSLSLTGATGIISAALNASGELVLTTP